jgi:pyridoxal phosphate enzyme (YggS family)
VYSFLKTLGGTLLVHFNQTRPRHLLVRLSITHSLTQPTNSECLAIPNLHTIQTLTSIKAATALDKYVPPERGSPLRVLIQINTSGEESKSGLSPLSESTEDTNLDTELVQLARHVVAECPHLHLEGLMTIGAIERSQQTTDSGENEDFERLKETRDVLQRWLTKEFAQLPESKRWGRADDHQLVLSMGMSSDFEAAIKAGSDIVRVGTGIFGSRPPKSSV